jgi:hypothetical protein
MSLQFILRTIHDHWTDPPGWLTHPPCAHVHMGYTSGDHGVYGRGMGTRPDGVWSGVCDGASDGVWPWGITCVDLHGYLVRTPCRTPLDIPPRTPRHTPPYPVHIPRVHHRLIPRHVG